MVEDPEKVVLEEPLTEGGETTSEEPISTPKDPKAVAKISMSNVNGKKLKNTISRISR